MCRTKPEWYGLKTNIGFWGRDIVVSARSLDRNLQTSNLNMCGGFLLIQPVTGTPTTSEFVTRSNCLKWSWGLQGRGLGRSPLRDHPAPGAPEGGAAPRLADHHLERSRADLWGAGDQWCKMSEYRHAVGSSSNMV